MLATVAAAALAFGRPSLEGQFTRGDDHRLILDHVFVNHPSWRHAGKLLTIVHDDLFQPLPMLSFQLNYALAGPDPAGRRPVSPFGFHLTNVLLHTLNACLACLVAARLAGCRRVGMATGLLFAVHPFAHEAVAWINGRMILMATTFTLAMLLTAVGPRGPVGALRTVGMVLAWAAALLSKVIPTIPIAAACCDLHVRRRLPASAWATYVVLLGIAGVAAIPAAQTATHLGLFEAASAETSAPAPVRLVLAAGYYVRNYVWPVELSAWSPPASAGEATSWPMTSAVAACSALVLVVIAAARTNRTIFLGVGLFLLFLAPFLFATLARRITTADRYMYLPAFGMHLSVATALVLLFDRCRARAGRGVAYAAVGLPAVAVAAALLLSGQRLVSSWRSSVERDRRCVEVYSDDPLVRVELARSLLWEKRPDDAMAVVAQARARWPGEPRLASVAGEIHMACRRWPEALRELEVAAARMPAQLRTRYNLGLVLHELGRRAEAETQFRRIVSQSGGAFLPALTALARACQANGRFDEAAAFYERALAANPYHRDSLFDLANLKIRRQDWAGAAILLGRILDVEPGDVAAATNLAVSLVNLGRSGEALAMYDRIVEKDPNIRVVRLNRAALLARAGRLHEAAADYRAVLETHPDDAEALDGLETLARRQRGGTTASGPSSRPSGDQRDLSKRVRRRGAGTARQ